MITTQVTWPVPKEDFRLIEETRAKALELGGEMMAITIASEPNFIAQRTWPNEAAANEWIEYTLSMGAESSSIVTPT